jgi:hypothetical protein
VCVCMQVVQGLVRACEPDRERARERERGRERAREREREREGTGAEN